MFVSNSVRGLGHQQIFDGLHESERQQAVKLARPSTLNETITQALEFEVVKQSARRHSCVRTVTAESPEKPNNVEELIILVYICVLFGNTYEIKLKLIKN